MRLQACLLSLCAWSATAIAAPTKPADVAGEWASTLTTTDGDEHELRLKLSRKAETLTGVAIHEHRELAVREGRAKGAEISFVIEDERDGRLVRATFEGKLDGDQLTGSVTARWEGGGAHLDWRATRLRTRTPAATPAP